MSTNQFVNRERARIIYKSWRHRPATHQTMIVGGVEVDLAPAVQAGVIEEMMTMREKRNPVLVGGGEKEVMTKAATMTTVAVIDIVVENTKEAVEKGTNPPHRGIIVIANDLKRRENAGIIHLPAMIVAVIAVLIATAAALLHLDIFPNVVKNHAKNRPKSPLLLINRPTTMCK